MHLMLDSEAYNTFPESHRITIRKSSKSLRTSDCNSIGVM